MGYLPFGGGVTLCPGRRFARNEVKTMVAFLFSHFDLSFADPKLKLSTLTSTSSNPVHPGYDGARAGIGIYPPKYDVPVYVTSLTLE